MNDFALVLLVAHCCQKGLRLFRRGQGSACHCQPTKDGEKVSVWYGMVPYRRTFATKISFGSLTVLEFVALALGELLLSQNLQLLGHKSSLTTLVRAHGDLVLFVWLALVLVCCFLSREGLVLLMAGLVAAPPGLVPKGPKICFSTDLKNSIPHLSDLQP